MRSLFLHINIRRYSKPHCPCFVRHCRAKRTYNAKGCEATNEAKLRVPPSPPRQNKLHIVCDAFTSPLHSFRCFSSSPKSRLFGDPIFNKRNFLHIKHQAVLETALSVFCEALRTPMRQSFFQRKMTGGVFII